ncbi:hypothetical protein AMECASPLE_010403 [Ameca splendens]|uniref:C-type lectin domain-containing protein n=1 Tax=Ameca splendens TaxID=208324 RepID=A0ABV0YCF1_9TELE
MELLHYFTAVSVLCAASSLTEFHFVNELKNWTEAQMYCREQYTDLVTLSSMENVTTLVNMVDLNTMVYDKIQHLAWIGLVNDPNGWRWSMSDPNFFKNTGDTEFRNWKVGEPNYQNSEYCVRIYDDGLWNDISCESYEKSVCAEVNGQDVTFVLITSFMTWTAAQTYCRQHHTDLAMARDMSENDRIKQVMPPGQYAWIGLYRSPWGWVDGSNFLFTYWKSGEPNNDYEKCVIANFDDSGSWENCPCDWKFPFFCKSDKQENIQVPVSKHVVKLRLEKHSSLDLNDVAALKDLLTQFEQKLKDDKVEGDIRLSWREQSDGTIFVKDG